MNSQQPHPDGDIASQGAPPGRAGREPDRRTEALGSVLVGIVFGAFTGGALYWAELGKGTGALVMHAVVGALIGAVAGCLYYLLILPLRRPVYTARRAALTAAVTRKSLGDALTASMKGSRLDVLWAALTTGLQFGALAVLLVLLFKGGALWAVVAATAGLLIGALVGAARALVADTFGGFLVWAWSRIIAGRPIAGAISGAVPGAAFGGWCGFQVFQKQSTAGAIAGSLVFAGCFGLVIGYFGVFIATKMQEARPPLTPKQDGISPSSAANDEATTD